MKSSNQLPIFAKIHRKKRVREHFGDVHVNDVQQHFDSINSNNGLQFSNTDIGEFRQIAYTYFLIKPSNNKKLNFMPGSKNSELTSFTPDDLGGLIATVDRYGHIIFPEDKLIPTCLIPDNARNGGSLKEVRITSVGGNKGQYWKLEKGRIRNVGYPNFYIDCKKPVASGVRICLTNGSYNNVTGWCFGDTESDDILYENLGGDAVTKTAKSASTTATATAYATDTDAPKSASVTSSTSVPTVFNTTSDKKSASVTSSTSAQSYINNFMKYVNRPFRLKSQQNNTYCIDTWGHQNNSGTTIHIAGVNSKPHRNQVWTIDSSNRLISWDNRNTMLYLASQPVLAKIKNNNNATKNEAKWILDEKGFIRSMANKKKVLTIKDANVKSKTEVVIADDKDALYQRWQLVEVAVPNPYRIVSNIFEPALPANTFKQYVGKPFRILNAKNKSYCIDTDYKQNGGGKFHLWTVQSSPQRNQIWTIDSSNRLISWENRNSTMYLDKAQNSQRITIVGISGNANATKDNCKWVLDKDGHICSALDPTQMIDVANAKMANGSAIITYKNGGANKWVIQVVALPANHKLKGDIYVAGEPNNNIKDLKPYVDKDIVISSIHNPQFVVRTSAIKASTQLDLGSLSDVDHKFVKWRVDKYGRLLLSSDKTLCAYASTAKATSNIVLKKVSDLAFTDLRQFWLLEGKQLRSISGTTHGFNVCGGASQIKNGGKMITYKLSNANNEQFAVNEYMTTSAKCVLAVNNTYLVTKSFGEKNIAKGDRYEFKVTNAAKCNVTLKRLKDSKYMCAEDNKKDVNINRTSVGSWETFTVYPTYNGYAFKTKHGTWLAVNNNKIVQATSPTPIKKVVVEKYIYKNNGIHLKANFVPTEKKSLTERFMSMFKPSHNTEAFGDVDVSVNNTTTNTTNMNFQSAYNAIKNNKDLYTDITTNIDKANEIINKAKNEINKKTEAAAKAETKQSNTMTGKSFSVSGSSNVNFNLSNKATTAIQLMVYAESLSSLDSKKYNKAMIADMIGMTSSSDTSDKSDQSNDNKSKADASAAVETGVEQFTISAFAATPRRSNFVKECMLDASVSVQNTETNTTNVSDVSSTNIDETNVTERQIQQYCEHLTESTQNIDENVQNLAANLEAVSKVDQSNEFSFEEVEIKNSSDVNINLLNESDQQLVMDYKEMMNQVATTIAESETKNETTTNTSTESTTTTEGTQSTSAEGDASAGSDVTAKVDQTGGIVKIICVIVTLIVALIVGFFLFKHFYKNNNNTNAEENVKETEITSVPYSSVEENLDTHVAYPVVEEVEEPVVEEVAEPVVEEPIIEEKVDTHVAYPVVEEPIVEEKVEPVTEPVAKPVIEETLEENAEIEPLERLEQEPEYETNEVF